MQKNRETTEEVILESVTALVRDEGFEALGVNAVARRAGISKVLIYRYFDSWQGLLEAWALRRNFWVSMDARPEEALARAAGDPEAVATILKGLIRAQAGELRRDRVSREILRWFIARKDAAASSVMAKVEKRGAALVEAAGTAAGGKDLSALSSIVLSGVYYLALLSDRAGEFNGVEISSDAGWDHLLTSIDVLIDTLVGRA